ASAAVNTTTGRFSHEIVLAEGANTIMVVARDTAGNTATDARSVTLDTTAPSLTVTAPAQGSRLATISVQVTGTTDADATVSVNGISAPVSSIGGFDVTIVLLDGHHTVTIVATDPAGNHGQVVRTIDVGPAPDTTAPVVTVTNPADGATVDQASVAVSGTVDDTSATVIVTGVAVHPAADGSWRRAAPPLSLYSCRGERVAGMPQKSASSTTRAGPPTVQGIVSIPRSAIALRTCSARSGNVFT